MLTDSHPFTNLTCIILHVVNLAAAVPRTRRVLARRGRAGENNGLFEHPAGTSIGTTANPTFPNEWVQNSFPTAC